MQRKTSKTLTLCALLCLQTLVSVQTFGQGRADLDRLDLQIRNHFQTALPGWTYRRVEPFTPGSNILIEVWSNANRTVKVAISVNQSVQTAKDELKHFVQSVRGPEALKGFGDEAYTSGLESSDIVLRRGRYVIYINTFAEVEGDTDAATLTRSERSERRKTDQQRISKEFARHVIETEL